MPRDDSGEDRRLLALWADADPEIVLAGIVLRSKRAS